MSFLNHIYAPPARYRDLTFRCFAETNGVARLDTSMAPSAGGAATDPDFVFLGGDADATDWTTASYPVTPVACARQAVATPPTYNDGSPCLGTNDDSVMFHDSDYYEAPNTSFGQIATEDFVVEVVFRTGALAANDALFGTRNAGVGWYIYSTAANTMVLHIQDAGGTSSVVSAALNPWTWYHGLWFLNRDASGQCYINSVASGAAVDISGESATITNSEEFCLGARGGGSLRYDSNIAYAAMWKGAGWLTSHLNPDTAAERFAKLAGYWPQVAKGTTVAPSVATRAYQAYSEKIESSKTRLYQVGGEWLRYCQRVDSNGKTVNGYLPESAATNDLDNGDVFAGWTKEDAGDVIADNAVTGPDNLTSMATLTCDNTNGNHGISDATANNLSAVNHCASAVIGTGNCATWWKVENSTIANGACWFNMSTGALGTQEAGVSEAGFVEGEYLGTGTKVRRPYIRFTGTVAPHTILIAPCDADGGDTFSGGDGAAVTGYFFGSQVEEGDYPTSIIPTAGAAATRLADQLRFVGDDGHLGGVGSDKRGTIAYGFLLPDYDNAVNTAVITISDGGALADQLGFVHDSDDKITSFSRATAGNPGDIVGPTDMSDGVYHEVVDMNWQDNDLRAEIDGSHAGQDTTCDIPDDLDRIDIGQYSTAALQFNGLLTDIKIWKTNRRYARR